MYINRHINYGNKKHINVTVTVQENNKAVIFVALDASDKNYYACDGGCLDEPVLLGWICLENNDIYFSKIYVFFFIADNSLRCFLFS